MKRYIKLADSVYRYRGPVYHQDYGRVDYISDIQNSDCFETRADSKKQALNFLRYRYIGLHTQYDPTRTKLIQLDPNCIYRMNDIDVDRSDVDDKDDISDDSVPEQLNLF